MDGKGDKTLALMSSKALGALLRFGGGLVVARFLTMTEYATYSQVMLIASTAVIIPAAFQQSLYYFIPLEAAYQRKRVIFSAIAAGLFFICLVTFFLLPFQKQVADLLNNPALIPVMPVTVVFLFCFCLSGYINPVLICLDEEIKLALAKGLSFILAFVVICASVTLHLRLGILIAGLAFSYAMLSVYTVFISRKLNREISIFSSVNWEEIQKQFGYSFPLFLGSIFGVIGRRLDQYLVSACFDVHEYAIYARGAIELPFSEIVTMSIFTILIPQFVRLYDQKDTRGILDLWRNGVRRVALIFFPFSAFFVLKAKPLMVLLFSEKYAESAPIFQVYAIQLIIGIALYGAIPRSTGKTNIIYRATIIFAISNLIMSYPLILAIGPIGAAVGTALSGFLGTSYYLVSIKRILKCKFGEVFPWKQLLQTASLAITSMIVVLLVFPVGLSPSIDILCSFLLFATIVLLCYFRFGFLTREDKIYLYSIFARIYHRVNILR